MLHIILMVLKILGILILGILGLGLCVGLLVLLCPIRYYLEGSIYGKPKGHIRISWLFRMVCATVSYQGSQLAFKLCIFGIQLKRRKKRDSSASLKDEKKEQSVKMQQREEDEKKGSKSEIEVKGVQEKKEIKFEREVEIVQQRKEGKREEGKIQQIEEREDDLQQIKEYEKEIEENDIEITKSNRKDWWQLFQRIVGIIKNISVKIKEVLTKIKNSFYKIRETFLAIRTGIQNFFVFLGNLNKKRQAIVAFIREEKNKQAFRYTGGKLFQLLRHVLPGKVTLKLHYGFSDPAITGILTGMIFMFYPKSAEKFQLMPDFENRVLEGEITVKGRVRLIKVGWIFLSIYFHKECNRIIKMILKHEII